MTPKQPEMTIKEPIDTLIVEDSETQAACLRSIQRRQIRELLFSTDENAAYKNLELELLNFQLLTLQRKLEKDIAERKQTEERLFESEQRLNRVLNTIQTGVVIIDAQTHVIFDVNQYAADLIGLPKERIIGNTCQQFICPALSGKCPFVETERKTDSSEQLLMRARWGSSPDTEKSDPHSDQSAGISTGKFFGYHGTGARKRGASEGQSCGGNCQHGQKRVSGQYQP